MTGRDAEPGLRTFPADRDTCSWPDDCPTVEQCRTGCVVPAAASRDASGVATRDASRHPRGARDGSQVLSDASRVDTMVPARQLPAVPAWVDDRAKWVTLDRATRRRLERHHRRQRQ